MRSIPIYKGEKGSILLNLQDLSTNDQKFLTEVAVDLFDRTKLRSSYSLKRCTFFADPAYESLTEIASETGRILDPRIEGADDNPFDQHYWVAGNFETEQRVLEAVAFDPIFNYVGIQKLAWQSLLAYYNRRRRVEHNKSIWDGGVRINTMGI